MAEELRQVLASAAPKRTAPASPAGTAASRPEQRHPAGGRVLDPRGAREAERRQVTVLYGKFEWARRR